MMNSRPKRNSAYFASLPSKQVEEELLKLCIGERFEGDIAFLIRLYDGESSFEKNAEIRAMVIRANPHRHSSICPPGPGELPIPAP